MLHNLLYSLPRARSREEVVDVLNLLLDRGADPNAVSTIDAFNARIAPVMLAQGDAEIMKILIQHGATVNKGMLLSLH